VAAHNSNNQSGGAQPPPPPPDCDDDPPPPWCGCDPGTGASATHPISGVTGRETLNRTDLAVKGVYPIELTRRYDSQSEFDSALGYGWAWRFDHQLYEYADGSVVVRTTCGYPMRFLPTGGGLVAEGNRQEELSATGAGTYELRYPRERRARFDADGRLSELLDASGNKLVFSYASDGFQSLWGTSPFSIDPSAPIEVARLPQLESIHEVLADSTVTGREVTFTYNSTTGRLETATDDNGRSVSYVHDVVSPNLTKGNLVQVVGLEGIEDTYAYADPNDPHNLTSSTLGQGTTAWVNTYDAQDRVMQQTRGHRVIAFDYSAPLTTVVTRTIKNAAGATIGTAAERFEYDTQNRLTKKVDPLGNEREFVRDANGFLDLERLYHKQGANLVLQKTIDYTYGLDGNLAAKAVTLDSSETVTESWTYDDHWIASHQIVSSAAPTKLFREEYTFERDAQNRPLRIASAKRRRDDGSFETTSFAYDANGQVTTITPPAVTPADNLTIARSYFPSGANVGMLQQVEVQVSGSPDPHLARSFTYDARDEIATVTNARSFASEYAFDDLGRLERIENALGEETFFRYRGPSATGSFESAPAGAFLSEVEIGTTAADGEGQLRRLRYDAEGRLARVERKDDAGTWSTFLTYAYDSDDNRRQVTDAVGRDFFFTYDGLRRLTGVADEASNTTGFAYDAEGNRIAVLDAKSRYTYFTYDDLDRLVAIDQDAESLVTGFQYDAAGNVTKVIDPKSQETDYAYDALSRLTSVEQPLGQTVAYAYDGRGRLASTTNARGHVLRYSYHPWGGLEEVNEFTDSAASTHTKTVSYTYDNEGSITTVNDDAAPGGPLLYTYVYDALDRVDTTTVHYLPGADRTLDSDYDRFGNRKRLELEDGAESLVQQWTFDDLDRLVSAALAGGTTTYGYRPNDELETLTRASGVQTTYTYFAHGPVDTITTRDGSSVLLHLLDYTVDATLNVDTIAETRGTGSAQTFDYAYDGVDRLVEALNPTAYGLPATEESEYDAAGNRETPGSPSDYAYDANNRITASSGATYAFDDDGNLETKNAGLSSEERFTFDKTNRLVAWEKGLPTPTASASYAYDPFGRRIRKVANGTTTWFVWDGDVPAAEFDGSGARTRRYTYDGGWAPAELVTKNGSTETAYAATTDHLDTPRMLTNGAGVAVWRSSHEAFGRAVVDEDPDGDSNLVSFHVRFPGQYADTETGLHYNWHRTMDPAVGMYISVDAVGQLGLADNRLPSTPMLPDWGIVGGDRNGAVPYWMSRSLVNPAGDDLAGAWNLTTVRIVDRGAFLDINSYRYVHANPQALIDPTGEYGVVGALGGAAFNFGAQFAAGYYASGGDWALALKCINLVDVAISGAVGAVFPTFVGNVVGGKAGPYGLSRATNAAIWAFVALPGGYAAKKAAPDFRIGSDCDCAGLGLTNALGQLVHGI
jgi:RHS repeat-associated protein